MLFVEQFAASKNSWAQLCQRRTLAAVNAVDVLAIHGDSWQQRSRAGSIVADDATLIDAGRLSGLLKALSNLYSVAGRPTGDAPMGTLIVVDCEAPFGVGSPSVGDMTEFGDVGVDPTPNYTRDIKQGLARWDAYVNVPDPDALAAEFSSRNVEFSEPLKDTDDGLRGFELKEADGYVVVFRPSSFMRSAFSFQLLGTLATRSATRPPD